MHIHAVRFASHHWTPPLTWVMGFGVTLVIVGTLYAVGALTMWAYPSQRIAPLVQVNDTYIGASTVPEAAAALKRQDLSNHRVTLHIGNQTHQTTLQSMGIQIDEEATMTAVLSRQHEARDGIRPWRFWRPRQNPLVVRLDEERFNTFYKKKLDRYSGEPTDATLTFESGKVMIQPGKDTWKFNKTVLRNRVVRAAKRLRSQVSIRASRRTPEVRQPHLQPLQKKAQQWLERGVTITHKDASYTPSTDEFSSWIKVSKNTGAPELEIARKPVRAYIKTLAKDINRDPTPVRRVLENGAEVAREAGTPGRKIRTDKSITAIAEAIKNGKRNVALRVRMIKPGVENTHTYTASEQGMEALLASFADTHSGEYGLAIQTLDGEIRATHNAGKQFVTASTYKMYLAYAVYAEVENGNVDMGEETGQGTVGFCLRKMIVYSTNRCAWALGEVVGWKRADELLNQAGFHETALNNQIRARDNKLTTASDAANFMRRLRAGDLLNQRHTQRLLKHLRIQIYRSGIPSGTSRTVANKIGFLQGYLHDVGIVEGQGRDYVLAIYSYGGQWWEFRELVREVEEVLGP